MNNEKLSCDEFNSINKSESHDILKMENYEISKNN